MHNEHGLPILANFLDLLDPQASQSSHFPVDLFHPVPETFDPARISQLCTTTLTPVVQLGNLFVSIVSSSHAGHLCPPSVIVIPTLLHAAPQYISNSDVVKSETKLTHAPLPIRKLQVYGVPSSHPTVTSTQTERSYKAPSPKPDASSCTYLVRTNARS